MSRLDFAFDGLGGNANVFKEWAEMISESSRELAAPSGHEDRTEGAFAQAEDEPTRTNVQRSCVPIAEKPRGALIGLDEFDSELLREALCATENNQAGSRSRALANGPGFSCNRQR